MNRDDLLIKQALTAPPQGTGIMIPLQTQNGTENVPIEVANFEVLKALLNEVREQNGLLLAVHHHLSNPEKRAQGNRDQCGVCQQVAFVKEQLEISNAKQEEESETDGDA